MTKENDFHLMRSTDKQESVHFIKLHTPLLPHSALRTLLFSLKKEVNLLCVTSC